MRTTAPPASTPSSEALIHSKDYRDFLRDEFRKRIEQNPLYSLRAFARDLKISPSRLSEIFSKKNNLSLSTAQKISQTLGLSKIESEHFYDLVKYQKAKSDQRKILELKFSHRQETEKYQLNMDTFNVIAEWYHFAILEMTGMTGFKEDSQWIAKRLDVNPNFIQAAIDRMLRLKLLVRDKNGKLHASEDWTLSPNDIPSSALQKAHKNLLAKALQALYEVPVEVRDFSNVIMTFDPEQLPLAKEQIKNFRRTFKRSLPKSSRCHRLYSLAIQFYPLDRRV